MGTLDGVVCFNLHKRLISGHIQIAQVPDRGEPDMNGEVNYKYIFQQLEDLGYDGYIGLEYKPRSKSVYIYDDG